MQTEISTPTWQLVITVIAIIIAPIVALQISKYLENRKMKKDRKHYIFSTLMGTRAARLSVEHIQALNMIDVEFYGDNKKDSRVVEGWKIYRDSLYDLNLRDKNIVTWQDKIDDLFIELLQKMAVSLNYDFDKSVLTKTSYNPERHATIDYENNIIRSELAKIVSGEKPFPIKVMEHKNANKIRG